MNSKAPELQPSMLLDFRATNARSFKEELEFSMRATAMAEAEYVREMPWREGGSPLRVLPVAGVFGANASGKSNLLYAMHDMRNYVLHSFRSGDPSGGLPRWSFLLDPEVRESPSTYEVEIVLHGVLHEYGFVLDSERVLEEWAYRYPKGRAALIFHRHGDDVKYGSIERPKSRAILDLLRPNALFLSTAASANHPLLLPLYQWFQRNLLLADPKSRQIRQAFTRVMLDDPQMHKAVRELLDAADLGISDARKKKVHPEIQARMHQAIGIMLGTEGNLEERTALVLDELSGVNFIHQSAHGEVEIDSEEESLGTQVWFGLIGPILMSLEAGSTLLIDEIDASLHMDLIEQVVRIYQSPETNSWPAQLIFNSHDPTLLADVGGNRLLGRDQVWFTEKFTDGSSIIYPLSSYRPRKQEAIEKRYREGWYGGKPILLLSKFDAAADRVKVEAR